jgi:predicted nucleic acid-binding protein
MPDWLVQVLIQYPIVVIVGLVAWYAYQKIERVMEARVKREETLHTTTIAKREEAHKEGIARVKNEIGDLKAEMREEFKRLGKKIDDLNRRLGS